VCPILFVSYSHTLGGECEGHVARVGEGRDVYRVLVGKPERKRPLVRLKSKWEDNIKMEFQAMGVWRYGQV
jgi:hypothetical protein